MKNTLILLAILVASISRAQIVSEKFDLTIETTLSDTLQKVYGQFLNNKVSHISLALLEKRYQHSEYYDFLKTKKFYQSRKKWIKENSHEESIIIEGQPYKIAHFDSLVFERRFLGVDREFVKSEIFLDSLDTKIALLEMFDGAKNDIIDMCYNPRHAVIFYDEQMNVSGIYEICFECSNVKIGIVGTIMFAKSLPKIKALFEKYQVDLNKADSKDK